MVKTAANSGCFSPPLFAIFYAFAFLFEEKLSQICIRNHKKMMVKTLVFATHLAPKRSAFSTKTQKIGIKSGLRGAIYRQIAPYR